MRTVIAVLASLFLAGAAHAQRSFSQAELDAMLAPIALQPDGLVSQILIASTFPEQVAAAASWSRANPHLHGDEAVRAVQQETWDPAVKALVAFPDLLARMDDKPQWLRDLGEAFLNQEAQVMDTVQGLRRRAQAAGHLATTDQYAVYPYGEAIVVEPRTQFVYVRYYDPFIVYGAWWWPYYYPVYWRPWVARPVFVTHGFFYAKADWYRRHVQVVHKPVHAPNHHVSPGRWQPQKHGAVKPHVQAPAPRPHVRAPEPRPHVRVPESQRRPIVQQHMPAASGFSHPRPQPQPRQSQGYQIRESKQFNLHPGGGRQLGNPGHRGGSPRGQRG